MTESKLNPIIYFFVGGAWLYFICFSPYMISQFLNTPFAIWITGLSFLFALISTLWRNDILVKLSSEDYRKNILEFYYNDYEFYNDIKSIKPFLKFKWYGLFLGNFVRYLLSVAITLMIIFIISLIVFWLAYDPLIYSQVGEIINQASKEGINADIVEWKEKMNPNVYIEKFRNGKVLDDIQFSNFETFFLSFTLTYFSIVIFSSVFTKFPFFHSLSDRIKQAVKYYDAYEDEDEDDK